MVFRQRKLRETIKQELKASFTLFNFIEKDLAKVEPKRSKSVEAFKKIRKTRRQKHDRGNLGI